MRVNMVGAFIRNAPFGTEIAFAKGMRRIGHEVNEIDTSYPDQRWWHDADATIVFKWMDRQEYWEQLEECKGVKIVYQPDDARFPHIRQMLLDMRHYVDYALTFDDNGSKVALQMGYRDAQYMPVTADDELYCPDPTVVRDIDVSFVGSLTGGSNHLSRRRMCDLVQDWCALNGRTCFFAETYFNGEGPSPLEVYRRSKVVLNHATDVGQPFGKGYGLQCRHFEVGMTATALLSNSLLGENQESVRMPFCGFTDVKGLFMALDLLLNQGHHELFGRNMYNSIQAHHLPQHRATQLEDFIRRQLGRCTCD